MTDQERQALLTLAIMAALSDGNDDPAERGQVKRIAESTSLGGGIDASAVYQDVLLKRVSLDDAVAALTSPENRHLVYELCVGVCNADGALSDAERTFLSALQARLRFDAAAVAAADTLTAQAGALAVAPLAATSAHEPPARSGAMTAQEQDQLILNYAILNGALELLPDSLATMAIIPLQMRMVYRIGKSYGFELDRGHIKDLLATAGIGMVGQYVERIGSGLIGHLLGRGLFGGLIGGVLGQAVSSGVAFATTYALGRLAVRYYAGGRTFSPQVLRDTYSGLLDEARGLQGRYLPAMQEKARTINVAQILQEVRA